MKSLGTMAKVGGVLGYAAYNSQPPIGASAASRQAVCCGCLPFAAPSHGVHLCIALGLPQARTTFGCAAPPPSFFHCPKENQSLTQETEELRRKWNKTKEEIDSINQNVIIIK